MRALHPFPLINKKKKFILFTNAKCGGTKIKSWFLSSLELEKNFSSLPAALSNFGLTFAFYWLAKFRKFPRTKDIQKDDALLRKFVVNYRNATNDLIRHKGDIQDYYKVAIVRNPYDRVVSGFVDKFCTTELDKPFVKEVLNSIGKNAKDKVTFEDFLTYLETTDNNTVDTHWRRQTFVLELFEMDKLVDINDMAEAFKSLEQEFAVTTDVDFSTKRQSNTYKSSENDETQYWGNKSSLQLREHKQTSGHFPAKEAFLNEENKKRIASIYAKDFDYLSSLYQP